MTSGIGPSRQIVIFYSVRFLLFIFLLQVFLDIPDDLISKWRTLSTAVLCGYIMAYWRTGRRVYSS